MLASFAAGWPVLEWWTLRDYVIMTAWFYLQKDVVVINYKIITLLLIGQLIPRNKCDNNTNSEILILVCIMWLVSVSY